MSLDVHSHLGKKHSAPSNQYVAAGESTRTWMQPEQLGGAGSFSDAQDSPLVGQLSVLLNELVSTADHLSQLFNRLGTLPLADAETSYRHVLRTLIKTLTVIDNEFDNFSRKSSIRICVENYINRNLSRKDINPERLSKELEIPRSSLYKAFSSSGGVHKYIQDKRLDVARILLAHPEEHRSLVHIADSLGFESGAQFSKAFRRRFGCAPRNARIQTTSRPR